MAADVGHGLRPAANSLEYGETLMYGQYSKDLGEYAKQIKVRRRKAPSPDEELPSGFRAYTVPKCNTCRKICIWLRDSVIIKIGEDWIFLTMLGVTMALLSYGMDFIIGKCQIARQWMFEELEFNVAAQYFAWISFTFVFICFSTGFVHIVGPNAIGSGIPEMKTILRGVVLKDYLSFRTLVSKVVGLCSSLGSGLPIGKEGPFVHNASIVASLLGKLITSSKGVYENESRNNELLAAACAVGVSCTFAAPIGGVLFSIEVTATYFAVRNYWRGFYSAVCGAFVFRLLAVWFKDEETLTAFFKINLNQDIPFDPVEIVAYIIIGIVCGFAGALFVFTHRKFVEFMRKQKKVSNFLQRNRFIFPMIVSLVIASLLFPPGLGQFMAGGLTSHAALGDLFSNFTWAVGEPDNIEQQTILSHWTGPLSNIYITLTLFILMRFWMSAIAITLPVPAGVFMPVFTVGAAFGRLVGESMAIWFPSGIGGHPVLPAGYAIVGAAALSGSVTHTISTSVIVFELTGHMGHVLPCVIAVLISNATACSLAPSIYDSLIQIKRLPFLPGIINPRVINAHTVCVDHFMVRDVCFLASTSTYTHACALMQKHTFRSFPLVDSPENMILLGSIQRQELAAAIDRQLSDSNKVHYFQNIYQEELKTAPESDDVGEVNPGAQKVERSTSTNSASSRFSVQTSTSDSPHVHFKTMVDVNELTMEQEHQWEEYQLTQPIDFQSCQIDPAPFQLVEKTSLYKVHSLFSLLSLHHAYVTEMGQLVGVVSLKEVRSAIQGYTSTSMELTHRHGDNTWRVPDTTHPTDLELTDITESTDNDAASSA